MHAERNLIIEIAAARNDKSQVVENTLAKSVHEREPVRGRKINARLPFLGAAFQSGWRKPDLHLNPSRGAHSSTKSHGCQLLAPNARPTVPRVCRAWRERRNDRDIAQ